MKDLLRLIGTGVMWLLITVALLALSLWLHIAFIEAVVAR